MAFFEILASGLSALRTIMWCGPLLVLLAVAGLYLTWQLRGIQFRGLPLALKALFAKSAATSSSNGQLSHFQAMMTAMASAIGTGSIAGVATALAIGGFGAIFWMWVTAIFGMSISFSESLLSVKFRTRDQSGRMVGGPMYVLRDGLKAPRLAKFYAVAACLASFGIGVTVQANSVASALNTVFGVDPFWTGSALVLVTLAVLMGGVQAVGRISAVIVPVMAAAYLLLGTGILWVYSDALIPALKAIVYYAFSTQAAAGGFAGATLMRGMQMGVARGVFSSECGMGSTAIAAATARTEEPVQQGLLAMLGMGFASLGICTMTALVVMVTQSVGYLDMEGATLTGAPLVIHSFAQVYPYGGHLVTIGLLFFAYSTTMAWSFYGTQCIHYLAGGRGVAIYKWVYAFALLPGALLSLEFVWIFADVMNGLMVIPNLIGVLMLSPIVRSEMLSYWERQKRPVSAPSPELVNVTVVEGAV